jgi:hypothetical protein
MTGFQKELSGEEIAIISQKLHGQTPETLREIMNDASRRVMACSAARTKDNSTISLKQPASPTTEELEAQMTALIAHQILCQNSQRPGQG